MRTRSPLPMVGTLRERCRAFTASLRGVSDAFPFLRPVDVHTYTDYEAKIAPSRPVDLSHIARRLREREHWYATFEEMLADYRRLVSNCLGYNERPDFDALIRGMAERIGARAEAFAAEVYADPTAPGPRSKAAATAATAAPPPPPDAPEPAPEPAASGGTAVDPDSWIQCDRA